MFRPVERRKPGRQTTGPRPTRVARVAVRQGRNTVRHYMHVVLGANLAADAAMVKGSYIQVAEGVDQHRGQIALSVADPTDKGVVKLHDGGNGTSTLRLEFVLPSWARETPLRSRIAALKDVRAGRIILAVPPEVLRDG